MMSLYSTLQFCASALFFAAPSFAQQTSFSERPLFEHYRNSNDLQKQSQIQVVGTDYYKFRGNSIGIFIPAICYHTGSGIDIDEWAFYHGNEKHGYDAFLTYTHFDCLTSLVYEYERGYLSVAITGDVKDGEVRSNVELTVKVSKQASSDQKPSFLKPLSNPLKQKEFELSAFSGSEEQIRAKFFTPGSNWVKIKTKYDKSIIVVGRRGDPKGEIETWHVFKLFADKYQPIVQYRVGFEWSSEVRYDSKANRIVIWGKDLPSSKDAEVSSGKEFVLLSVSPDFGNPVFSD